jgi:hypothetical protein
MDDQDQPPMKILTTRIQTCCCPYCQEIVEGATSAEGKTPRLGAVCICIYCAQVSWFGLGLVLEKIPEPELSGILADPRVQQMQVKVRKLPRLPGIRR